MVTSQTDPPIRGLDRPSHTKEPNLSCPFYIWHPPHLHQCSIITQILGNTLTSCPAHHLPLIWMLTHLNLNTHAHFCFSCCAAVKIKKPIQTKFRMPVLNWVALKPSQINGTIFNDIDDESILQVQERDLNIFLVHQFQSMISWSMTVVKTSYKTSRNT